MAGEDEVLLTQHLTRQRRGGDHDTQLGAQADGEARPAGVTTTRPRGGGIPAGEDEHEGSGRTEARPRTRG